MSAILMPRQGPSHPLYSCHTDNVFFGGFTGYFAPDGSLYQYAAEADAQIVIHGRHYWRGLSFVAAATNLTGAAATIRSRINGNYGRQIITVPTGAQGAQLWSDPYGVDDVRPGDKVCIEIGMIGVTGNITARSGVSSLMQQIVMPGNTVSPWPISAPGTNPVVAVGAAAYAPKGSGGFAGGAVEAQLQITPRIGLVSRAFYRRIVSNTMPDGNAVCKTRINNVDGKLINSFGAGQTGSLEVFAHELINPGDVIDYQVQETGSSGAVGEGMWSETMYGRERLNVTFIGLNGAGGFTAAGAGVAFGLKRYFGPAGQATPASMQTAAGEGLVSLPCIYPCRLQHLYVKPIDNTCNANTVITVRKNLAATGLTVTIPGGSTTIAEDNSHIVDMAGYNFIAASGDTWNFEVDTTASGSGKFGAALICIGVMPL